MKNNPIKIILHHDGVIRHGDSFDVINHYHKEKFGVESELGFFVGYHYLIEYTGAIRQAREEHEEGVHTIGENSQSIGICLAGNFDKELPTPAQLESLGMLLVTICDKYKISEDDIFPHRMFSLKTCFGSRLPNDFGRSVCLYRRIKLEVSKYIQ